MTGGIVPYSSSEQIAISGYPIGSIVSYNGRLYRSVIDNNMLSPLSTDGAINNGQPTWEEVDFIKVPYKNDGTPVGTVISFAGPSVPNNYRLCNGAQLPRIEYNELFEAIGTIYGEGDGSTTFNLPNLNNRFIQGSNTVGAIMKAGLPNITGALSTTPYGGTLSGAFVEEGADSSIFATSGAGALGVKTKFSASESNSIYGASNTVQPPALTMKYCIKAK
jgi:microcystin-dependent protein